MDYERLSKDQLIAIVRQIQNDKMQNPSAIVESIRKLKIDYNRENFILLVMDNKLKILKQKILFLGSVDQAAVDLKILMREAISTKRCTGIIVAHNHPSGETRPSSEDITFTKRLSDACKLLHLQFFDSIIFTDLNHLSMKEENMM
jgi:DNA repair protein RadC